jgi:hypothetical protein
MTQAPEPPASWPKLCDTSKSTSSTVEPVPTVVAPPGRSTFRPDCA